MKAAITRGLINVVFCLLLCAVALGPLLILDLHPNLVTQNLVLTAAIWGVVCIFGGGAGFFYIRQFLARLAEQKAILYTMAEGILVIDPHNEIRTYNPAALDLLDIQDVRHFMGRDYREVISSSEVREFFNSALAGNVGEPITVTLGGSVYRTLELRAIPLIASRVVAPGVLFVIYDITRIRKLEGIRRDFIANVSHELRTPVTSIKGFVETLLEGAKDEPESLDRFLGIIARQADRLNSIFNDLLTLAKLEAGRAGVNIELEVSELGELIGAAIDDCEHRAVEKGMRLEVKLNHLARCKLKVNATLIQQAIVNLIDNAIKYSDNSGVVTIEAKVESGEVAISVIDNGPGIERDHLDRLFERFYRVDQGRSRNLGGTGLGLSIVKHIAHVHGGRITVESEVGQGSRFTLHLGLL
jgi:two-component system phosphate regulon sensor histidine kinase PhoR